MNMAVVIGFGNVREPIAMRILCYGKKLGNF
jgi:hypothetical protein